MSFEVKLSEIVVKDLKMVARIEWRDRFMTGS
jgi:hypothetical protein